MFDDEGRKCIGQVGFVGCPHCDGPVDVRAEIYSAVGDFLDGLTLFLKTSESSQKKLDRVWAEARERRWMYLERVFPFDLLEPFQETDEDEPADPQTSKAASSGGAAGTDPAHRALLPRPCETGGGSTPAG